MESAYQKRAAGAKKRKGKRVAAEKKRENGRDQRRLAQLLVSLVLFLLVFLGRGLFPEHLKNWSELIGSDVNFGETFSEIIHTLKENGDVGQALKGFGQSLIGAETGGDPTSSEPPRPGISVIPLMETGRFGLDKAKEYGITKYMPDPTASEPEETQPSSTAEPEVVTAVAQTYAEDGRELPSNVSFLYYELGLEKTTVPVSGSVTSDFGFRKNPITGKQEFHLAIDIAAKSGTEIVAFADGVVRYIGESDEFGLYFMIDHANGVSTFYAHCSKLLVKKGEQVSCGETVALVGSTGNATGAHLHLTILKDDIRLDPSYYVDP